ncbi:hypothetical protein RB601_006308 [Gaeumannomyces tritici]
MPSTADGAGNPQRVLDMETRLKLFKLGIGRVGDSTPNLPTFTTPAFEPAPSLQERRRDSLPRTDDPDPMLRSFRRSITAPPLSINIPPNRDAALVDSTGGGDDDGSASDHSSICNSPSWEDYGRKKDKKKKKKNRMTMDASALLSKRKSKAADKDAGAKPSTKLTKAGGGHRQSLQLPAPPVPPLPLASPWNNSNNNSAHGSGGIMKTTDLQVGSSPRSGLGGEFANYSSAPAGGSGAPRIPMPASMSAGSGPGGSGFVGGIRLEQEKQAAARAVLASHSQPPSHQPTPSHSRNGSLSVFPSVRSVSPSRREQSVFPGPALDSNNPPPPPPPPPPHPSQTQPRGPGVANMPAPVPPPMLQHRSTQSTNIIPPSHAADQPVQRNLGAHGRSQSLLSATASKIFHKQRPSRSCQLPSLPNGAQLPQPSPLPTPWNGSVETYAAHQQAGQWGMANPNQGYFPPQVAADYTASPDSMTAPPQQFQYTHPHQPHHDANSSSYGQQGFVRNHEHMASAGPSTPGRSPQLASAKPARDASDSSSSATSPGRSFKDKAKAMLNRTSLLPPAHPAQDRPANPPGPTITGPFNPRGTGPYFQMSSEDYHSSDSSPSPYEPQASGGSSVSSLDDASSPATTPDSSRPQSSKDVHAVVGEVVAQQGPAHDPVGGGGALPHNARAFQTSSQAGTMAVGAKSAPPRPVRPRRSSSGYSQQGGHGSSQPGRSYWAEPNSGPASAAPAPGAGGANAFIVDFDGDGSLAPPLHHQPAGPQQQQQQQAGQPGTAAARDEVGEAAATWQSIIGLGGEPEGGDDSSGQASHEESDDSAGRASTSFLPPLRHEPFIPPKSRARKSRVVPRGGGAAGFAQQVGDGTGAAAAAAAADEQPQQPSRAVSSGAAYLKEARKSIHAPSPNMMKNGGGGGGGGARMSIGPPPPAIPRELLLRTQTFPPPGGVAAGGGLGNRKSLHPGVQGQQLQPLMVPNVPQQQQQQTPEQKQQQLVTVSRRSLVVPPLPSPSSSSSAPSSSRPVSSLRVAAPPGAAAAAAAALKEGGGGLAVGQQMAKMLVVCCGCAFFQDMPSCVYECMANPDAVVEDRAIGISGAITTSVKCCWCGHNMSTACCAGFTAIVHLTQKLH